MRILSSLLLFGSLAGCIAAPFEGPGFEDGAVLEGPFIVAATHTKILDGGRFRDHLDAIKRQQDNHDGFVGRSLRTQLPSQTRWTMSIFDSEESMLLFVTEGAHLQAMLDSRETIEGVRSAVWTVENDDEFPPSWSRALDELDRQSPEIPWE